MSDYSTVQERDAFDERIFETIQEYLEDKDSYLKDGITENEIGLSINPKTLDLELSNKGNNPEKSDFFPIEKLIRPNENKDGFEPDCDATYDLASSYYFIR